jgi:hypothetical protein
MRVDEQGICAVNVNGNESTASHLQYMLWRRNSRAQCKNRKLQQKASFVGKTVFFPGPWQKRKQIKYPAQHTYPPTPHMPQTQNSDKQIKGQCSSTRSCTTTRHLVQDFFPLPYIRLTHLLHSPSMCASHRTSKGKKVRLTTRPISFLNVKKWISQASKLSTIFFANCEYAYTLFNLILQT